MDSKLFSAGFMAASFALLFVCLMVPLFYIIFYTFKKRFNFVILLAGVIGFVLLGYLFTGMLAGTFAPLSLAGVLSPGAYAIRRALCVGVVKAVGLWLVLALLNKRYLTTIVPISYAVGYSLIDMVLVRGVTGYISLSQALAVNQNGLDYVVSTVELTKQEALRQSILDLAAKSPFLYVWGTADSVCAFIATVCIARLLWYAIEGGIREKSPLLIPVCVLAAVALEIPGALYDGGAFAGYAPAGIIYYVMTALLLGGTILVARRHDEKIQVADTRLRRRVR